MRNTTCFLAGVVCLLLGTSARAQLAYVGQSGTTPGGIKGGCAPTAVANGLVYLDNLSADSIPNLFVGGSPASTANQLALNMGTTAAAGTAPASRDSGLATYLTAQKTPVYISGGQAPAALSVTTAGVLQQNPTPIYMENQLAAGHAVEFGQYWGTQQQVAAANNTFGATGNGGHVLTLLAMTGATSGSMSFEDPTDPKEVDNLAWSLVFNASQGVNFIYVTGDTWGAANDQDDGVDEGVDQGDGSVYTSFAISDDVAEAVPDSPSVLVDIMALLPLAVGSLRALRNKKTA